MATDENEDAESEKATHGNPNNSRRNFLKAGLAFAVVLVVTGIAALTKTLVSPASLPTTQGISASLSGFPKMKIANISDLSLGESITFNYPLEETPNILARLGSKAQGGVGPDGDVVAFSQICQHLGCIYGFLGPGASPSCDTRYKASGPVGYCCCHGSVFDFVNAAKVIAGPSLRPQPQVMLEFDTSTGDIYAIGMTPPTIFGHHTGSNDVSYDLQGGTLVK